VYHPLPRLQRLTLIKIALFRSPYILTKMALNAFQIDEEGSCENSKGQRPFTAQAIADCIVKSEPHDLLENQKAILASLAKQCPAKSSSEAW